MATLNYFISYRRVTDNESALRIAAELVELVKPADVFYDKDEQSLPAGVSWPREIVDRLYRADVVLVIISSGWFQELQARNSAADGHWLSGIESSDWVRREIAFSLQFGKRVLPVLLGDAQVPESRMLPGDLSDLSLIQGIRYSSTEELVRVATTTLQQLSPLSLSSNDLPSLSTGEEKDDPDGAEGVLWDPDIERDSPHLMDYKYCIVDERERHRLRVGLLATSPMNAYGPHLTIRDLQIAGRPRKYRISSAKRGMFLQASCIVTDGMQGTPITRVLVCIRESFQFHDRRDARFVKGESCLIASCMTSFNFHRNSIHLPNSLLNDLENHNPWAVFSRKLLVPDSVVDCRFLGMGFNLNDSDKEYIHLVWHVRTRMCPQAMLVPAREKADHEAVFWVTLEELTQFNFEKAPIDRAVVESLFGLHAPRTDRRSLSGFVSVPSLEGGKVRMASPERWVRDTVPLDLTRMFQLAVHRRQVSLMSAHCRDVLSAFMTFVETLISNDRIPVSIQDVEFQAAAPPFQHGVKLCVMDEAGETVGVYLVLAVESLASGLTSHTVGQIRERAMTGFDVSTAATGVLILNSVHTSERFELHGALSLHDAATTPIHVIRIASGSSGVPLKRICHALIPVASGKGLQPDSLIATRTGDERPRLPGGKIEGEETPHQAIQRELNEELNLESSEFEILQGLPAHSMFEVSPSTSRLTHYQIYPFLVKVHGTGVNKVVRQATNPLPTDPCRVFATSLEEWVSTGFGFDTSYPESLLPRITPELMNAAVLSTSLPIQSFYS